MKALMNSFLPMESGQIFPINIRRSNHKFRNNNIKYGLELDNLSTQI